MNKKAHPAIGRQDSRRAGLLTTRVLLLSLFLILILSLFFHQFYRKLEHSLWEEKQGQYQYLADQSAQLINQQINEDQRFLQSLVRQTASLNQGNAAAILDENDIRWVSEGPYAPLAR